MFQTYKVIILVLVIFSLTNIVHSYQFKDQNQTQNYIQIELDVQIEPIEQVEQIKTINPYPELFQYNIFSLVVCLFFINQQI